MGALIALFGLAGCLVTDPVEFETAEGSPPMLVDLPSPTVRLGHIAWVDTTTGVPSWKFPVRVHDDDVGQTLTARWRIVTKGNPTPRIEPEIELPPTGSELRDLEILVEPGQLDMGQCHRLDIAVSSAFYEVVDDPTAFAFPQVLDDLAVGNWWIWEGPGRLAASDALKRDLIDSCNAVESLLEPIVPIEETLP